MTEAATLAPVGHNNPPADPFDALKLHMDDLYVETANWADGVEIENAEQAETVERLINDWKDAIAATEAAREGEIKPLSDQVTAIRERYYPLIGETKKVTGIAIRAKAALLAVKTKWANKLAAERAAEAERLRKEAAAKAAEAQAALRHAPDDIAMVESAEDLIRDAQSTLRAAQTAEKPAVKGMRDNWVVKGFQPVEVDGKWIDGKVTLLRHYFKTNPAALVEACLELAKADVRAGKRAIPGLIIENDRRAV